MHNDFSFPAGYIHRYRPSSDALTLFMRRVVPSTLYLGPKGFIIFCAVGSAPSADSDHPRNSPADCSSHVTFTFTSANGKGSWSKKSTVQSCWIDDKDYILLLHSSSYAIQLLGLCIKLSLLFTLRTPLHCALNIEGQSSFTHGRLIRRITVAIGFI